MVAQRVAGGEANMERAKKKNSMGKLGIEQINLLGGLLGPSNRPCGWPWGGPPPAGAGAAAMALIEDIPAGVKDVGKLVETAALALLVAPPPPPLRW